MTRALRYIALYEMIGGVAGSILMGTVYLSGPNHRLNAFIIPSLLPFAFLLHAGWRLWRRARNAILWSILAQLMQIPQFALPLGMWKFCAGLYVTVVATLRGIVGGVGVDLTFSAGTISSKDVRAIGLNFIPMIMAILLSLLARQQRMQDRRTRSSTLHPGGSVPTS